MNRLWVFVLGLAILASTLLATPPSGAFVRLPATAQADQLWQEANKA